MANVLLFLLELVLLLLLLLQLQAIAAMPRSDTLHPHCQASCGNFSIPYPFGIGPDCYRDKSFEITCKPNIDNGTIMPYSLGINSRLAVFGISVSHSQATMLKHLSYDCYNASGSADYRSSGLNLTRTPFAVSATRNRFTAIGCQTIAYVNGTNGSYVSGCMSFCNKLDYSASGSCTGIGCCQTSLPENLVDYYSQFYSRGANDSTWKFDPCSYSFVADQDWFKFNISYLKGDYFKSQFRQGVPLVLDWVAGKVTCEQAKKNNTSYACRSNNSDCRDSTHSLGYTCSCSRGYEGNPYLEDGCQDIRECDHLDQYPCHGICENKEGGYSCSCPPGQHSDDPKTVKCVPNPRSDGLPLWVKLALGIGSGIVFILLLSFWIYMMNEKRKLAKEKERFFQQNGGLLLYEEIKSKSSRQWASFKIFRKEEMEKATNDFDKNLILGRGGHGTVYRGILEGNVTVAIKKSRMIDESQKEEFVKEILILSQINHKNVVKLLGCCLEVEVPMLVYEFVSSGTVHDYIHGKNRSQFIPLDTRLRIAIESAGALAYLHSSASPPILHGDVKSSNILLDENYAAKVSDFGASTLVALDETQLATIIQGTCGYLDPEYLHTYIFTEKSDVYSFGVVLLELLTRRKAVYFEGSKQEKLLASTFITLMKEGRLMEVLDHQLSNGEQVEEGKIELLHEVSELAKQCLSMRGEERPTMKEVAEELQRLRKFTQHPWEQHKPEELEVLLGESYSYSTGDTSEYYSLETRAALDIEARR